MKIRWNRNSLRLRITPSELAALQAGRVVEESLAVPGGSGWTLILSASGTETLLKQSGTAVMVQIAVADLQRLGEPEREGVYFIHGTPPQTLAYYIEKDFPCAYPRAEEVRALSATGAPEETFPIPANFAERRHEE